MFYFCASFTKFQNFDNFWRNHKVAVLKSVGIYLPVSLCVIICLQVLLFCLIGPVCQSLHGCLCMLNLHGCFMDFCFLSNNTYIVSFMSLSCARIARFSGKYSKGPHRFYNLPQSLFRTYDVGTWLYWFKLIWMDAISLIDAGHQKWWQKFRHLFEEEVNSFVRISSITYWCFYDMPVKNSDCCFRQITFKLIIL